MRGNGDSAERERWARRATSFGTQAAVYAERRPDYAAAAIRWALEPIATIEAPAVLDLGAGTGKLTGGLLAVGAEAVAVEPDASMRAEFVRRYPAVTILAGTAEEIPLPDDSVDAVVAGQAFHWFEQSRAFPEIARVLRPGGVFAAFWNIEDGTTEWVAGLQRVARSEASTPPPPPDEPLPSHPLFAPFEKAVFAHAQRRTVDSLVETLGTHSHTVVIPAEQRGARGGRRTGQKSAPPAAPPARFR
ncbi:class I SAM-dependent methyltransferase [Nocardia neocaledoniensis]|uniref:class I SAM-dependent methyltransferase n=1 Tax=Nocardia neocaledoniensis TaxID=236511 RepID=UPI00245483EA|nr:class I SAM-dependent methyltransferase [Nocardia neocaledoniensis]